MDQYKMTALKLATLNNQIVFAVDYGKNRILYNRTSK